MKSPQFFNKQLNLLKGVRSVYVPIFLYFFLLDFSINFTEMFFVIYFFLN